MRDMELKDELALAHRGLGSWSAVAALCGDNPKTEKPYSPTMAWWWASGQRAAPDHVADAWYANVTRGMLKSWLPRRRKERVSIEVSPSTRDSLRLRLKQPDDTWDDAFSRVLSDTHTGSAPHLFGCLGIQALQSVIADLELAVYYHGVGYNGGFKYTDDDMTTIHWWLDRAELELSMRKTPDWFRAGSYYDYDTRSADYYERF